MESDKIDRIKAIVKRAWNGPGCYNIFVSDEDGNMEEDQFCPTKEEELVEHIAHLHEEDDIFVGKGLEEVEVVYWVPYFGKHSIVVSYGDGNATAIGMMEWENEDMSDAIAHYESDFDGFDRGPYGLRDGVKCESFASHTEEAAAIASIPAEYK